MRPRHIGFLCAGVACVGDVAIVPNDGGGEASALDGSTFDVGADSEGGTALSSVNGKIVDSRGLPVAGASLRVGANGGVTQTSDANGAFTILAPPTYDISVASPGGKHTVTSYLGLSRRDPKLTLGDVAPSTSTITLAGSIAGAPAKSLGASTYALAAGVGSDAWGYATTPSAGTYSVVNATYVGPSNGTGNLSVLVANSSLGEGPYFMGTSSSIGLANGGTFNAINLAVTTPTETSMTGTVTTAGGSLVGLRKQITLSPGVGIEFAFDPGAVSFNTKFPAIGGGTLSINAVVGGVPSASGNAWAFASGVKAGDPPVSLTIPAAPIPSAPADGAIGVDASSQLFQWAGSGLSFVSIQCKVGDAGAAAFNILTSAHQLTLPDAADLGVPTLTGAACSWSVTSLTAFADVDDAAKDGLLGGRPSMMFALLSRTGAEVSSPARSFALK